MWLALRFAVFVVAFCIRAWARVSHGDADDSIDGRPSYRKVLKQPKSKSIVGFRLGVDLVAPVVMRMHRESGLDLWFKALGLAREVQTGDEAFDCLVYVACDHGGVHDLLTRDARARQAIRAVFEAGYRTIRHDGRVLWIERASKVEPTDRDRELLAELARALGDLESRLWAQPNPFAWRAFACESCAWGVGGFALASLPFAIISLDRSLAAGTLLGYGLAAGAAVFAPCALGVIVALRGSSRARLVIVECVAVLLVSLPVAGVQSIADVNAGTGQVATSSAERRILEARAKTTGSGKRRRTTYTLVVADGPAVGGHAIPTSIHASRSLYEEARIGGLLAITVHRGSLGLPWVEYRALQEPSDSKAADRGSSDGSSDGPSDGPSDGSGDGSAR